jgi:cellulose synthase/poly-beta-1,6-N-acetylglucosamine synthase-like glycosyltransferase
MANSRATPSVSIVLPVRDGAAFVAESIESILHQTLAEFELLVIDDGSQDATPKLLAQFANSDPRVRVLTQPSLGIAAALNRGLRESRAPLVARMDADDIAVPERLSIQIAAFGDRPRVAGVGSSCRVIDQNGKLLSYRGVPTAADEIRRGLLHTNCMIHPTMMLRRDAVLGIGGYRPAFRYCEDFDLWLRLSERYDLLNVPEPLLNYRVHDSQSTWQNLEERAIVELGAITLANQRRRGLSDQVDEFTNINRAFLLKLGVTERCISQHLALSMLGAANEAIKERRFSWARTAIQLLLQQPALSLSMRLRGFRLLLRSSIIKR